jgi:hypothetical protein
MTHLRVDIESLVLDGAQLEPSKGRRLAALTQRALARLLRDRGVSPPAGAADKEAAQGKVSATMKSPVGASETRWAEELAEVLYRAIDRVS